MYLLTVRVGPVTYCIPNHWSLPMRRNNWVEIITYTFRFDSNENSRKKEKNKKQLFLFHFHRPRLFHNFSWWLSIQTVNHVRNSNTNPKNTGKTLLKPKKSQLRESVCQFESGGKPNSNYWMLGLPFVSDLLIVIMAIPNQLEIDNLHFIIAILRLLTITISQLYISIFVYFSGTLMTIDRQRSIGRVL